MHGDPIQGIDPTGLMLNLGGFTGYFQARLAEAKLQFTIGYHALSRLEFAVYSHLWVIEYYATLTLTGPFLLDAGLEALINNTEPVPYEGQPRAEFYEGKLKANATDYNIIDDHRGGRRVGNTIVGGSSTSLKSMDPK